MNDVVTFLLRYSSSCLKVSFILARYTYIHASDNVVYIRFSSDSVEFSEPKDVFCSFDAFMEVSPVPFSVSSTFRGFCFAAFACIEFHLPSLTPFNKQWRINFSSEFPARQFAVDRSQKFIIIRFVEY